MCSRPSAVNYPKRQRSRIENKPNRLPGVDMRTANGRRYTELFNSFAAGFDGDLNELDLTLIRQASGLALKSEMMAADLANGRDVPAEDLIKIAGVVRRTLDAVSAASASSKPSGGDAFQAYLAKHAAAQAEDNEGDESDDEDRVSK